ncbi:DUF4355 domain-containing protein [Bacillus idriensis]|uniref:DUF4355 domain-containing protein n=1 Tax=Metabacillus idriensis TaxID=324768 RepID=A0A6I2MCU7_9BACI|nr:DUF4355 domain-containing protein [Metabacillus idriensis]MRX54836.1 DUF4355 domain-containing protein [Metabacillus idriensis]
MTLEEIKAFLESNKDQADVKAYLGELSAVSADKVKGFLETDEGKRVIQPELDRYHSKSLDSWKTNNLNKLVDEEVAKRNPAKSPAELEVEKLRKEIEDERKARNRESLKNKALEVAAEKNLPKGVLDFFIGEDEEKTLANLSTFEAEVTAAIQAGVEAKFKSGGRNPNGGSGDPKGDAGAFGKKIADTVASKHTGLEDARKSYFE